ncbi:MAG: recombinase family protein [Lachnospirales bacterium]
MSENKIYKATMYMRLSKEDGDKSESDSISNQKDLIRNFVDRQEDIEIVSEKVDDGYTGVTFDRPAFMEMLDDARDKKIDCIIVKDLSRLGRNFIEMGKYLENIFPFMGIRFIAIIDDIDTLKDRTSHDNLILPVKNLMNDAYARDISIKIRSQLEVKRKKGQYIGPFAPYGYLVEDKKLVVDTIAKATVEEIFRLKILGMSSGKIAEKFNSDGVLSPTEHKNSIGINQKCNFKVNQKALWTAMTITRILKNPVYIGTLVQGKTTTPNYKIKKRFDVPEDKRVVIEDNHEAIIDKFTFETVQKLLKVDTRTSPKEKVVFPLAGIAVCGDCGSNMIKKNNGTSETPYFYYICSGHKKKNGCTSHSIRDIKVEKAILVSLERYIEGVLELETFIDGLEENKNTSNEVVNYNSLLSAKKSELERFEKNVLQVFDDFKCGILDENEYSIYENKYKEKVVKCKESIENLERSIQNLLSGNSKSKEWIEHFKKYKKIQALSRKLVVELIDNVKIYEDKVIHIDFKFQSEFEVIKSLTKSMRVGE